MLITGFFNYFKPRVTESLIARLETVITIAMQQLHYKLRLSKYTETKLQFKQWLSQVKHTCSWRDNLTVLLKSSKFFWFWRWESDFKGCVRYIFASMFFMSKRQHFQNKEKCLLFHLESSFCFWDNQILTFQIFKCHDVIKCLSMKHETHFTE